jgi:hypothetical protein
MSKYFYKYGMSVDARKIAKDLEVCVFLLDRLAKESYINEDKPDILHNWDDYKKRMVMEKELTEQDLDLLFHIMKRKIRTWWD